MKWMCAFAMLFTPLFASPLFASPQDQASTPAGQQLMAQYRLTNVNRAGEIVTAGSILVLQKHGLLVYSVSNPMAPQSTYKGGKISRNPLGGRAFGRDLVNVMKIPGASTNIDQHTLVIGVTQSGETADTIAGMQEARSKGAKLITICNVLGAAATRMSDGVIYTNAGPEIGVASTKAFTTQLTAFFLLSLYVRQLRGEDKQNLRAAMHELSSIPHKIERLLRQEKHIEALAHKYAKSQDFLFLGRGVHYPIALEGALKLKEISYIHAEGYPAGEMKHGPIALIDENMPIVAIATRTPVYEKTVSNLQEVKARDGKVIAICDEGDESMRAFADDVIEIPSTIESLQPILTVIPTQLLAYYIALKRGCDVDQPRNLAKSVTVE